MCGCKDSDAHGGMFRGLLIGMMDYCVSEQR